MTNEEFYATVNGVVDEIIATVSKQTLQPKAGPTRDPRDKTKYDKNSGCVYIVSIKNREVKEHRAGVVAIAPYWIAAKGIVERLHEVASDAQIREFLKEEAEKRFAIQSGFTQRKGIAQFTVPPVNDQGAK